MGKQKGQKMKKALTFSVGTQKTFPVFFGYDGEFLTVYPYHTFRVTRNQALLYLEAFSAGIACQGGFTDGKKDAIEIYVNGVLAKGDIIDVFDKAFPKCRSCGGTGMRWHCEPSGFTMPLVCPRCKGTGNGTDV